MKRLPTVAALLTGLAALISAHGARGAEVVVSINKASQTMSVLVDGVATHNWMVSTGLGGGPPAGSYQPLRLEKKWFSRKYNWSPMPNAIFFHEGYAVHGTVYVSRLGHRASHGCVRLHPSNAAVLFELVKLHGKANTRIVISNTDHVAALVVPEAAAAYVEPPGQMAP